jgi:hypothetical protein
MARIILSAKSGSEWTEDELTAFNVNIVWQNSAEFFGVSPLPDPDVPPAILTATASIAALAANDEVTWRFIFSLGRAVPGLESAVDAFVVELLRLMHYEALGRVALQNVNLTLTMCGKECHTQSDVCVMDSDSILLVVQQYKRDGSSVRLPEAQLLAEAIAAFDYNNQLRRRTSQDPVQDRMIPGIIMRGNLPIFYKFNITQDFVDCVRLGRRPAAVTKVFRHVPVYPDGFDFGMFPSRNRRVALECLEAFRTFVVPPHPSQ